MDFGSPRAGTLSVLVHAILNRFAARGNADPRPIALHRAEASPRSPRDVEDAVGGERVERPLRAEQHQGSPLTKRERPTTWSTSVLVGRTAAIETAKAFDAETGEELWKFGTGSGIVGSPVTWEQDGEQRVGIVAGCGGVSAAADRTHRGRRRIDPAPSPSGKPTCSSS